MCGKPPRVYSANDGAAQLKIITERLGGLGCRFDEHTRMVSPLGRHFEMSLDPDVNANITNWAAQNDTRPEPQPTILWQGSGLVHGVELAVWWS